MPILDPVHDLAHPVEGDSAWSESYYFNAYDPASASGLFTRVGFRPNEGTADVGCSIWLPDGDLAELRAVVPASEVGDRDFQIGPVRYQMLEAGSSWRLSAKATAPVRRCEAGSRHGREVELDLEVTFEALGPAIGTDGQARSQATQTSAAAAGSTGKGHLEQPGRYHGRLLVDGVEHAWGEGAMGNRDRSWGPRRWGGPRMWRWFSINVDADLHLGGIRIGTDAGDLHRGWVLDAGRAASVAAWEIETETLDDNLTQHVVHLEVVTKPGDRYQLRGDVLRVADIGQAKGTRINEGLTRWSLVGRNGEQVTGRVGHGIAEYLHQLDEAGAPLVPVA